MPIQKLFTSRVRNTNGNTFVGEKGHIFYDEFDGALHLSDGVTPGGHDINITATEANIGNIVVIGANITTIHSNESLNLIANAGSNVSVYGNLVVYNGNITATDLSINGLVGNVITSTSVKRSIQELDDSNWSMEQSGHDEFAFAPPLWTTSGSTFNLISAGYGWIRGKRIAWTQPQAVTLAPHVCSLVYIDETGTLRAVTSPALIVGNDAYHNFIPLFLALYDGTNIIVSREDHDYSFNTGMVEYIHINVGTVIAGSGANLINVTIGNGVVITDREVGILGADAIADSEINTTIPDSAGAGVSWNVYNTNSLGQWSLYASQTPFPMVYNNAGTPTAITNGNYGVFTLYAAKDNGNTTAPVYVAVMNTTQYANISLATSAITSGTTEVDSNELKNLQIAQLGYVVVQNNANGGIAANVIVSKSTFNSKLVGGGSVSSAGLITVDVSTYTAGNLLNTSATTVQSAFNTLNNITKSNLSLGNVENTALSTWPGTANITTVGTLPSLTVTGNILAGNVSATNLAANAFYSGNIQASTIATGGFVANIVTKSANYTITYTDYTILGNAFTGNVIFALPTAPTTGTIYNVKKIDISSNIVSVNGGATTIDDAPFANIKSQYNSIQIQWSGTSWYII